MALINCPECGREVSDKAEKCPNCGYNIGKQMIEMEDKKEKIKGNKFVTVLICVCAFSLIGNVVQFIRSSEDTRVKADDNSSKQVENTVAESNNSEKMSSMDSTQQAESNIDLSKATFSFQYVDTALIPDGKTSGTYRVGTDIPAGDYIVYGLYGTANIETYASLDTKENATYQSGLFISVNLQDGQYIEIYGGALFPQEIFDTNNLKQYGIFQVGTDIEEGEYRVVSILDEYNSNYASVGGNLGAYEIADSPLGGTVQESEQLVDQQKYIKLNEGQYVRLVDVALFKMD